jgi:hypothetical protein
LVLQGAIRDYLDTVLKVELVEQSLGATRGIRGADTPTNRPTADALGARPTQPAAVRPRQTWELMKLFQERLDDFEPVLESDKMRYAETLVLLDRLSEQRRLRGDIAAGGLRPAMWAVIYFGAVISIGVVFLFRLDNFALHATLVGLMAAFLGVVLFMIALNDKPYLGKAAIESTPYEKTLRTVGNMKSTCRRNG